MGVVFESGVRYPSDEVGEHRELVGRVLSVAEPLFTDERGNVNVSAKVNTDLGTFTAWYEGRNPPPVGSQATIRVYRSGGGWYPDDRLIGWCVPSGTAPSHPTRYERV